jgi:hypothetical protein
VNLRILAIHPGASWSTADVFDGLVYGLKAHGVTVIPYRTDERIASRARPSTTAGGSRRRFGRTS